MKIKFEQYKKVNKPIQVIITLMLIGLAVFLTTLSNVYTELMNLNGTV